MALYLGCVLFYNALRILTFYLRLLSQRGFRLFIGFGCGLNVNICLINLLLIIFQCTPVAAAFDPLMQLRGAECMNRYYVLLAPSTVVSLCDVHYAIVPTVTTKMD